MDSDEIALLSSSPSFAARDEFVDRVANRRRLHLDDFDWPAALISSVAASQDV
jgi:hypothetical protein